MNVRNALGKVIRELAVEVAPGWRVEVYDADMIDSYRVVVTKGGIGYVDTTELKAASKANSPERLRAVFESALRAAVDAAEHRK